MKICENCNKEHNGSYGKGRFCSKTCAKSFSTKEKRLDINIKISQKLKGCKSPKRKEPKKCLNCGNDCHKKFCSVECYKLYYQTLRTAFENYKIKSQFKFNVYDYPNYFELILIEKYGWYSPTNNLNGVSRDHLYSVKDGFINNIDCKIISHPANCKLVLHKDNQKKYKNSSITIDELKERIKNMANGQDGHAGVCKTSESSSTLGFASKL